MTREEIEALCAIAEQHDKASTPGPWIQAHHVEEPRAICAASSPDDSLLMLDVDGMAIFGNPADAAHAVESRVAWPALAKAARELLAENARLQAMVDQIEAL